MGLSPDILNNHLSDIGSSLSNHFRNAPPFKKTLYEVAKNFRNDPIYVDEVLKLIDKIKTYKSSGWGGTLSSIYLNFTYIDK